MRAAERDEPGAGPADFEAWYRSEFSAAVAVLGIVLTDRRLAEEAVSEAFARALADWPKVRAMASPGGWLYRVALNQARSWLRRRSLERRHPPDRPAPTMTADPDDRLWRAVRQLSPRARTAIALRYVADLPEKEVATAMGIKRGTVAATLSRARSQLAEQLVTQLEEEESR